jgi:hypothetical protein
MTKKHSYAALATPFVIALTLLFAASPNVRANGVGDQPSATAAEVKIDNFSFGRRNDRDVDEPR